MSHFVCDTKCRTGDWLVIDLWLEWTWLVTELHRFVVCLSLGHEDLSCPEKMED